MNVTSSRLPDPAVALIALVAAEAYLWLVGVGALRAAGDDSGLPTAAWLLPIAAVVAPWVLPARTERSRGAQALLGVLGCVVGAGVMVVHPLAGIIATLAWIAALTVTRR
ncbi:hypothetical protein [Mariniluteicoccus flavus]